MPETRVRKILAPMDGSDSAFRAASFAVDMANKYGSELILAYTLEVSPALSSLGIYGVSYPQNIEKLKEAARIEADPWFARIREEAKPLNVAVTAEAIEAPLSLVGTIVEYAEKNGIDLIIMGSRGRTGFKKLLLGSVASGVVTYAPCPVMVVK